MDKFKKYNDILCEQFCEEMKKFEEKPTYERLKSVKDLAEVWADLQCIEAGEAMRKLAEKKYGYHGDMTEWDEEAILDVYDVARGGRRNRDSRGRFISNRGGRTGYYAAYDGEKIMDKYPMYPPLYNKDMDEYPMYDKRDNRGGSYSRGEQKTRGEKGIYNAYDPDTVYEVRQHNGMPIITPYAKADKPKKLTDEQLREWLKEIENEDGTTGAHWKEAETTAEAQKIGVKFEEFTQKDFCVAMNMMYSDYCAVASKFGVDKPGFYAHLAKAFLEDEDSSEEGSAKLAAYYCAIVED